MSPTLGVVIPVGGSHGRYVGEALDSIVFGQGCFEPDQVVIVYDRIQPAEYPNVRTLETTRDRNGQSAARNIGLEALDTDYVFYLDADDLMDAHCCRKLREAMESGVDFIMADCFRLTRKGKWSHVITCDSPGMVIRKTQVGMAPLVGVSVCVKRDVALAVGGHDETLPYVMDNDFAIRVLMRPGATWRVVLGPIIHARSETSTRWEGLTIANEEPFLERLRSGYYLQTEGAVS